MATQPDHEPNGTGGDECPPKIELEGYTTPAATICSGCGVPETPDRKLKPCLGCRTANYCDTCQTKDWKKHKKECHLLRTAPTPASPSVATCSTCGTPETPNRKFKACSGCRTVNYCDTACQTKDWKKEGVPSPAETNERSKQR